MTQQLEARTLTEAYLFVELVVGRNVPVDLLDITTLERVEGWGVLRVNGWHDGELRDFVIMVPPGGLLAGTRPTGEWYGERDDRSLLIDAGQWRGVEDIATANIGALIEQTGGGGFTADQIDEASRNLDVALSALLEIGKFLPPGVDEVPAEAFWSDTGQLIRERQPEAFRRERLTRDEAVYRSFVDQIEAFWAAAEG